MLIVDIGVWLFIICTLAVTFTFYKEDLIKRNEGKFSINDDSKLLLARKFFTFGFFMSLFLLYHGFIFIFYDKILRNYLTY